MQEVKFEVLDPWASNIRSGTHDCNTVNDSHDSSQLSISGSASAVPHMKLKYS